MVYQKVLRTSLADNPRYFILRGLLPPVWNFPARNLSLPGLKFDGINQGKADAKSMCIAHSCSIASLRTQLST